MKRFFYLLVGIFIIFLFQHNALGANAYKIAVVDVQKLQKNSVAFQKTRTNLKKKFEVLQQKLDEEWAMASGVTRSEATSEVKALLQKGKQLYQEQVKS